MRIEFKAVGKTIEFWAETGKLNEDGRMTGFAATLDCGHVATAQIIGDYLTDQHQKAMQAIRLQAYNQGWADAKSKKTRKTIFIYQDEVIDTVGW